MTYLSLTLECPKIAHIPDNEWPSLSSCPHWWSTVCRVLSGSCYAMHTKTKWAAYCSLIAQLLSTFHHYVLTHKWFGASLSLSTARNNFLQETVSFIFHIWIRCLSSHTPRSSPSCINSMCTHCGCSNKKSWLVIRMTIAPWVIHKQMIALVMNMISRHWMPREEGMKLERNNCGCWQAVTSRYCLVTII